MKNPQYPLWGALCSLITAAHCAPVTWTTGPTSIDAANEASISLNGTFFHAGSWGSPQTAMPLDVVLPSETITFENLTAGAAVGANNAIATGGEFANNDLWIPTGTPDPSFLTVMRGMNPDGQNPKNVIVGRLVAGKQYQIQLFVSDDRSCCSGRTQEWSDNPVSGLGNRTSTFTNASSSHVIGTFTADGPTQTLYLRGVGQDATNVNAYILRDLSPDTDGDGIPDHIEIASPVLSESNPNDAQADADNDQASNLVEYQRGLNLSDADTDDDGIPDGEELYQTFTDPKLRDTDGDGIDDGAEFDVNGNPLLVDTDNDFFPDSYELQAGTQLDNPSSTPGNMVISNAGGLLTSDLTDPDNNGSDATEAGSGFDWVSATATSKPNFAANEAALNIFDNKTGGGEAKWCCDAPSQSVTVQFAEYTSLTHFTLTSHNDGAEFDPRVWEIQGSNDGSTFATIARIAYTRSSLWTGRNQTLRFDLPAPSLPYKYIRYQVQASGGGNHALAEIEYFGQQSNVDADQDGLPLLYEQAYDGFLSDSVASDAGADQDGDTLSNLDEFTMGTKPDNNDSDGDTLRDNFEAAVSANPLVFDTDGDGLSDGQEAGTDGTGGYGTMPNFADSDGDNFKDKYEVDAGSDPNDFLDTPGGVTINVRGIGATALIGGDLTDPQNDGNDSTDIGSGFDWASITATSKASFSPQEGAFNIFDNKVGGGEAKWCCDPAPQSVTVQMAADVSLTHFTLTSTDDAPERDPRVWAIQGSTDGVTFTDIFRYNDPTQPSLWGSRNQVMEFILPAASPNYRYLRYSVTTTGSASMHALGELEFFGTQGSVTDSDGDGMPNFWETQYGLNPNSNADATLDADNDQLNNLAEYAANTLPNNPDTDGDGLLDGLEGPAQANPLDADTDDDGLTDKADIDAGGKANDKDSDDDNFNDRYEFQMGTALNNAASTPGGATIQILGNGTGALLGRDVTDRDNDGNDGTAAGSGFDWTSITSTSEPYFHNAAPNQGEGAFDVFDNKVGGGEAKWCCEPGAPQSITVQLPYSVRLTHFTVTSSNDSPARDPRVWAVQGSNDGVNFTNLYSHQDSIVEAWTGRDQVLRFNLATAAPAYTWFRYQITSTGGNQIALGEIEYFGIEQDSDNDGLPDYYEVKNNSFLSPSNPNDALQDADGDGLNNLGEFNNRTNPLVRDTDGDGLSDNIEVTRVPATNPLTTDTDGDQISDGAELAGGGEPTNPESLPDFNEITWGSPSNITGNLSDFNTGGQLIHAWTGGGAPVAVNGLGITFQPGPSLGERVGGQDPDSRDNDPDYESLLDSASTAAQPRFLEIRGLLAGQTYRIQVWVADTRPGSEDLTWQFGTYDLDDPMVTLDSGAAGNPAKTGQFVTGTFVANYETQYVYIEGLVANGARYNAVTVHMTSTPPQPVKITSAGFVGGTFQLNVTNLDTTKSYQLRRSTTMSGFSPVGTPFTPSSPTRVVTDPAPPAGKAFYTIEDVP